MSTEDRNKAVCNQHSLQPDYISNPHTLQPDYISNWHTLHPDYIIHTSNNFTLFPLVLG